MKNQHLKSSIAFIFLALFLSMKMVGLHLLTHTDDNDHAIHCTLCDHAIVHNLIPAVSSDIQEFNIENIEFVEQQEIINHYEYSSCNSIATNQLFSRPPPYML